MQIKQFRAVLTTASVAALIFASLAVAQTTTTTSTLSTPPVRSQSMVIQIGPVGRALLRGTVDAVSGSSLTLKSWGGDWIINVSAGTQVLPKLSGVSSDIANFKQGDYVGVQGTVNQSASWTIDATLVRDWTYRQTLNQEMRQNQQAVNQIMQSTSARNYQGTASNVNTSARTFTLTAQNGTAYSVSLTSGALILQRTRLTLGFSQVQNGDLVRVWGSMSSSTISASIFRDMSR